MWACLMAGKIYRIEPNYDDAAYHLCDTPSLLRHKGDNIEPVLVLRESDLPEIAERMAEAHWNTAHTPKWSELHRSVKDMQAHLMRHLLAAFVPASVMKGIK